MKDKEKTKEQLLKESEERYKTYINTIPDIIYEIDTEGRFIFINDAIKQLGYSPKELIGKHLKEIIHPDDVKKISAVFMSYQDIREE